MLLSFDNKNISTGRRYITFNIKKVTSSSAGVYTCIATNKFGRQQNVFTVKIKGLLHDYENKLFLNDNSQNSLSLRDILCVTIFKSV